MKPVKDISKDLLITEEVHADEVHNDINALKTVINGRRDVAFVDLNKSMIEKIEKYNLKVLPVRMTSQNTIKSIIYRDKQKALRLYHIAKSREGYLSDRNPEEAREIGQLLGYTADSIEEYVQKKYGREIPLRTDGPDDYNDLHENTQINRIKHLIKKL